MLSNVGNKFLGVTIRLEYLVCYVNVFVVKLWMTKKESSGDEGFGKIVFLMIWVSGKVVKVSI